MYSMDRIMMFDHNIENIGLFTRPTTQGEELELVEEFIDYYIHAFLKNNKVNNLAVSNRTRKTVRFPQFCIENLRPTSRAAPLQGAGTPISGSRPSLRGLWHGVCFA